VNRIAVAKELVRLASLLVSFEDERRLREMTIHDIIAEKPVLNLKMVYRGTIDDLKAWAESKKLAWKNSSKDTFGGYWYDTRTHNAYIIT
jgi:hypothetical protein